MPGNPDVQRDAERQRFLAEASHLLSSTLDFTEALQHLARLAVPRLADWCGIYVANGHGVLQPVEIAHPDRAQVERALEVRRLIPSGPDDAHGAYQVLRSGRSELVREITEDMLAAAGLTERQRAVLAQLGLRSIMTVPLRARGRTFGVIQFGSAESGRLFDSDDLDFAEDLAQRAAFAADNARLYQAAEKRHREEAALRRATEAITATFSVDEIIQQIASSALEATDADGSYVERIRDEQVEVVAVAGTMHPAIGVRTQYRGSIAERVLDLGQPEVVQSRGDNPALLPGMLAATQAEPDALYVPLVDGGEAIGALVLLRASARDSFTPDEIERAHTFGNLAALAFRKVHLLEDSERRRAELEQVVRSRSRLMRGFTHDLKNPIGAADGHASLLEDGLLGNLSDEQLRSIGRIRASLANALKLIDDLNEFARAETGRLELKLVPTQIMEIAREIGEHYRLLAEQKGVMLDLELARVPIITTDDDRVRQVLGNLMSNALKYTSSGGRICIRTGVHASDGSEECVVIEVADTGIGIPEDKLDLIFEEFERIDPSVKPGLGLGLAISQRVAHALGGKLTVHSKRGEGSSFTLWLPAR